ncbi:MAG: MFS transporter [Desulfomonile tiedjei]|nr:MFS transporter [Desulfomonile tiedjei]
MSMFYRVSTAVISPSLINDLGFTNAQLSDLAAVFFYAFALSQLPIGVALDRVGARITMAFLALAAVGGALLFATGSTPAHLVVARVFLGIGMSGNLMVVLALLATWFPVNRFAFLSGLVVAVGVLGDLLAATPLALLSLSIGWRASFLVFAAINAIVVGTLLFVMRDHPPGHSPAPSEKQSLFGGLAELAKMYSYWAISLGSFVRYGYFAALRALWAGPFLIYGLGLGEIAASNALLIMGVGYMVGLPLGGSLSDSVLRSRKQIVLGSLVASCFVTLSFVWLAPSTPLWYVLLVFFVLGVMSAPGQIMYAHIKELLPPSMVARAITAVNLFTVLGAGVMTQLLGLVIEAEPSRLSGPDDFRSLWYVGVAALVIVSILYSFVPDSRALKKKDA